MAGLVVREDNGNLKWYPFFKQGTKHTFYTSKEYGHHQTGFKVGRGFHFDKYLPGYWQPVPAKESHRRIGGGSDLIVLDDDDLKYYRFERRTFMVDDTGDKVGRGFNTEWEYYVAEWTNNGTSDLLVRDDNGHLRLFPWNGQEFQDLGGDENVGDGFYQDRYPHIFPGYWRGNTYPDLLVREENGDLWLYPFDGKTFKDQGKPKKLGRGFDDKFSHYLIDKWVGNGTPDVIVRNDDDELILYPYGMYDKDKDHHVFADPPYKRVGRGFKEDWKYTVGHWEKPFTPSLLVCDDDNEMRFYPFGQNGFIDLDKDDKYVGQGWDFTHFWDFYPV